MALLSSVISTCCVWYRMFRFLISDSHEKSWLFFLFDFFFGSCFCASLLEPRGPPRDFVCAAVFLQMQHLPPLRQLHAGLRGLALSSHITDCSVKGITASADLRDLLLPSHHTQIVQLVWCFFLLQVQLFLVREISTLGSERSCGLTSQWKWVGFWVCMWDLFFGGCFL